MTRGPNATLAQIRFEGACFAITYYLFSDCCAEITSVSEQWLRYRRALTVGTWTSTLEHITMMLSDAITDRETTQNASQMGQCRVFNPHFPFDSRGIFAGFPQLRAPSPSAAGD